MLAHAGVDLVVDKDAAGDVDGERGGDEQVGDGCALGAQAVATAV